MTRMSRDLQKTKQTSNPDYLVERTGKARELRQSSRTRVKETKERTEAMWLRLNGSVGLRTLTALLGDPHSLPSTHIR